jgi:hypothetical protein
VIASGVRVGVRVGVATYRQGRRIALTLPLLLSRAYGHGFRAGGFRNFTDIGNLRVRPFVDRLPRGLGLQVALHSRPIVRPLLAGTPRVGRRQGRPDRVGRSAGGGANRSDARLASTAIGIDYGYAVE